MTVVGRMAEVLLWPLKQIPYFDWELLLFLPLPQCGPTKQGPAVQACDYISSPPTACPKAPQLVPPPAPLHGRHVAQDLHLRGVSDQIGLFSRHERETSSA